MKFSEIVDQTRILLQRTGKLTYRTLTREFALDAETLEDLKERNRTPGGGLLSGVGFLPKEEQSRHARESGNPEIPHYTGQSAWMPACAGMTGRRNQAGRKPVKIADDEKNLPFKGGGLYRAERGGEVRGKREGAGSLRIAAVQAAVK